MWITSFAGVAFWCYVVGSSILYPLSCWCTSKDVWHKESRVKLLRKCVQKDAYTSDMADLTVPWRIISPWFFQTGFVTLRQRMMTQVLPSAPVGSLQEFVCDSWMFEECEPPIPVPRLLGCSGFVDAVWSAKTAASNDIQEEMFLGGCLMWNDAAIWKLFIVFI